MLRHIRSNPRPPLFAACGMLIVLALGLGAFAKHIYLHQQTPSTSLMVLLSLSWTLAVMMLSLLLAIAPSGLGLRRAAIVPMPPVDPHIPLHRQRFLPRNVRRKPRIGLPSRLPAFCLFGASAGLFAVTARLYLEHRVTVAGAAIGLAMALFIASRGWNAWPESD